MSRCPDWRLLDPADRDAPDAPHAAARWREALRHLDSGCPHCRQQALAADPTLIFRRLPAPELGPAQEAEEVAAARLAVAAMRTASRLEGRDARESGSAGAGVRSSSAGLRSLPALYTRYARQPVHAARWALAAGLTAMALIFGSGHGWHTAAPVTAAGAASPLSTSAADRLADTAGAMAIPAGARALTATDMMSGRAAAAPGVLPASSRPSIEGLSRPEARVYQLDSPHMSVVMIVDDKLDV
jgi:hypothetical protein